MFENELERIASLIRERYVFPSEGERIAGVFERAAPALCDCSTREEFVRRTNELLFARSHDPHLELRDAEAAAASDEALISTSYLTPELGLLRITRFPSLRAAQGNATTDEFHREISQLFGAKALIVDIRRNEGGDGSSVALATSYFVQLGEQPLALYYSRASTEPTASYTWSTLPGGLEGHASPLLGVPVAVLVDSRTFSAAEEFAYNLQQLGRARIVGEVTRGGAHPTRYHRVSDGLILGVPFAETINPISRTNWEGTGVRPDLPCPSRTALAAAVRLLA